MWCLRYSNHYLHPNLTFPCWKGCSLGVGLRNDVMTTSRFWSILLFTAWSVAPLANLLHAYLLSQPPPLCVFWRHGTRMVFSRGLYSRTPYNFTAGWLIYSTSHSNNVNCHGMFSLQVIIWSLKILQLQKLLLKKLCTCAHSYVGMCAVCVHAGVIILRWMLPK